MSIEKEIRENLKNKLTKYIKIKEIYTKIEESIYNYSVEYANTNNTPFLLENIYDTKQIEILSLLETSNYILTLISNDKFDILKIAYLKPEELNPEAYENIIKKAELEDYKKNNKVGSNIFTCSKCKKANCTVVQKQTRAGDEPPTTFVTCLECGNVFRFN